MANSSQDASLPLAEIEEIISGFSIGTAVIACNIAAAALIFYDYFLTLYREIRSIWWTRFGSPSLLFYTVRYGAFLSSILIVLDVTQWSEQSNLTCAISIRLEMVLSALLFTAAATFSGLRAYAVCNRNRWALLGTLTLSLFYPAISVYTFTQSTATVTLVPVKSCSLSSTFSDDTYDKWLLGARTCTVVADLTVLGLTCMHTRSASVLGRTVGMKRTFSGTLMRDGTLYFLALSVVNIVGLGLWHREEVIEPITTWTAVLTAIMTSRFMLDLHEVSRATSTSIRTTFSLGEHSGSGRQNGTLAFMHGVEESAVSRIADEISGIHVYGNMTGIDGVDGDRLGGEAQWDEDWDEGDEQEGCHETSYGYAI